jgi:hypothetical protein
MNNEAIGPPEDLGEVADNDNEPPPLAPRRSARLQAIREAAQGHQIALTQEEREMLEEYQDDIAYNEWIDSQIAKSEVNYTPDRTLLVAKSILQINAKVAELGASYAQQYMLPRGLKKWGDKGADAAQKSRRANPHCARRIYECGQIYLTHCLE